jgi:phospholipid/cholesterol/gamma-HCH transport system ATP-binding protein
MQSNPVLKLEKVSLGYGSLSLFRELSFELSRNSTTAFFGMSGSGKTTLMKALAGLLPPRRGKITFESQNLYPEGLFGYSKEQIRLKQKIAMVFQKNALFSSLSLLDNLLFPMSERFRELARSKIKDEAEDLLKKVGLFTDRFCFPHEISGGMQKRLGLARAFSLKAELLVFDDPTAGLDPITSDQILSLIQELYKDRACTMVLVSNDLKKSREICDQVAFLFDDQVYLAGSWQEVAKSQDKRVLQYVHGKLQGPLGDFRFFDELAQG